jgi:hypothetical protein
MLVPTGVYDVRMVCTPWYPGHLVWSWAADCVHDVWCCLQQAGPGPLCACPLLTLSQSLPHHDHSACLCRYSSWHEPGGLGERIRSGQESFESLAQWVQGAGLGQGEQQLPSGRQELAELYLSWYV